MKDEAIIYIAKPGTRFDEGTVVVLIDDYRESDVSWPAGLFRGQRNGATDEEICGFEEFDEKESTAK